MFFLGMVGLYFVHKPRATLPVTVNFVEFLPGDDKGNGETRRAVFKLTNSTPWCIAVPRFQVEVFTNGGWQIHSNYLAGALIKPRQWPNMHLLLDPGESETLVVDCPKSGGWRIGASYLSEESGIQAVFARIQAVRQRPARDWGVLWRPGFRSFNISGSIHSDAIPEGPE